MVSVIQRWETIEKKKEQDDHEVHATLVEKSFSRGA